MARWLYFGFVLMFTPAFAQSVPVIRYDIASGPADGIQSLTAN
jgi:hypothetical protein